MSKPAAIQGQLVEARNIATHKCVRLWIDVPAEMGKTIIDTFGWPTMVDPVPVAVAWIKPPGGKTIDAVAEPKEQREWKDLPGPQQAGIMANDKRFWAYLREWHGRSTFNADHAAHNIRSICGVDSRSEFKPDTPALQRWNMLASAYLAWLEKERVSA